MSNSNTDKIIQIAQLALAFSRVERECTHEDGIRVETDSDHTVMLGLVACTFAKALYPQLDIGVVAQFALVHDVVEVYADDMSSFRITEDKKLEKQAREAAAMERIAVEYENAYDFIPSMIKRYELLDCSEARFIKTLDKCLPKITHYLNGGIYFKKTGASKEETADFFSAQLSDIEQSYGKEFPEMIVVLRELQQACLEVGY
jgi:putative hydrolases of HD superfamily